MKSANSWAMSSRNVVVGIMLACSGIGWIIPSERAYAEKIGDANESYVQGLAQAWDISRGEKRVVIACLDTGIDTGNESLSKNILPGINAIHLEQSVDDQTGHGTGVVGIIAAVAPNISILPIKILEGETSFSDADDGLIRGIEIAIEKKVDIIHLGIIPLIDNAFLRVRLAQAISAGIVVVAPTGNQGRNAVLAVCRYPGIIGVGALDEKGVRASFANYGRGLTVCARGVGVRTYGLASSTVIVEGTSFASAIVTGVVALMKSADSSLTPAELKSILAQSCVNTSSVEWLPEIGFGEITASRAVTLASTFSSKMRENTVGQRTRKVRFESMNRLNIDHPGPNQKVTKLFRLLNSTRTVQDAGIYEVYLDGILVSDPVEVSPIGPGEESFLQVSFVTPPVGCRTSCLMTLRIDGKPARFAMPLVVDPAEHHHLSLAGARIISRDDTGKQFTVGVTVLNSGNQRESSVLVKALKVAHGEELASARLDSIEPGELRELEISIDVNQLSEKKLFRVLVDAAPGQTDAKGMSAILGIVRQSEILQPQWMAGVHPQLERGGLLFFANAHVRAIELATQIFRTEGLEFFESIIADGADAPATVLSDGTVVFGEDFLVSPGNAACKQQDSLSHHWYGRPGFWGGHGKIEYGFGFKKKKSCLDFGIFGKLCVNIPVPKNVARLSLYEGSLHKANRLYTDELLPNYGAGKFERSYHLLGRISHLLTDVGMPSHAHAAPHGGGFKGGELGFYYQSVAGFSIANLFFAPFHPVVVGSRAFIGTVLIGIAGVDAVEAVASFAMSEYSVAPTSNPFQISNVPMSGSSLEEIFTNLRNISAQFPSASPPETIFSTLLNPIVIALLGSCVDKDMSNPSILHNAPKLLDALVFGSQGWFSGDIFTPLPGGGDAFDTVAATAGADLTAALIIPPTVRSVAGFWEMFRNDVKPFMPNLITSPTAPIGGTIIQVTPGRTFGPGVETQRVEFQHSVDGVNWFSNRFLNGGVDFTPGTGGVYEDDFIDISGLACWSDIFIRVRSIDTGGTDSDFLTFKTHILPLPITVPVLNAVTNNGTGTVVLNWTATVLAPGCPPIAGYNVRRALSPSGPFTKVNVSPILLTTFTDTTALPIGVPQFYEVTTLIRTTEPKNELTDPTSNVVQIVPRLPGGTALTAKGELASIRLEWNTPITLGYYPFSLGIFRSITAASQPLVRTVPVSPGELVDFETPLQNLTVFYHVAAVDSQGNLGPASNVVSAIAICRTPPPPTITVVSECEGRVRTILLDTFGADCPIVGYKVFRDSIRLRPELVPSFFTDEPPPGLFTYKAIGIDVQGHESPQAIISSETVVPRMVGWPRHGGDRHGLRNSPVDIALGSGTPGIDVVWSRTGHSGINNFLAVDRFGTLYSRLSNGNLQALDSKTGNIKWTDPSFYFNASFTVLDPAGTLYQLRRTATGGELVAELVALPSHDGPAPPTPRWVKPVLSGERLTPIVIGRDGTLIVEGQRFRETPFFVGLDPFDGSEVWRVDHIQDLLIFMAFDCKQPARIFAGGVGNPGSGIAVMQAFSLTTTGEAPIPFDRTFTIDKMIGLPVLANPEGDTVLSVAVSIAPDRSVSSEIIVHNTKTPDPELDTSFTVFPPGNPGANLFSGAFSPFHLVGAAMASRAGTQLAFLGTTDGFLTVVDMGTGMLAPSLLVSVGKTISLPVVSADRWLVTGAGATFASEIVVVDLETGTVVESIVSPRRVVVPPSIGLDGFWFVVDLVGNLRGFDVPGLPEGPLPPEELDEETVSDAILPRALISSPAVDTSVSNVVDIRGIAAGARFDEYILEAGKGQAPEQYDLITQSNEPVWNGSLGMWDTRNLESGEYTLRLSVKDKAGNTSQASVVVQVEALPPTLIVDASVFPETFSVDQGDVVITYILTRDTPVQVVVVPFRSNRRVWMSEAFESGGLGGHAGENIIIWDGRNDQGVPIQPGQYVVVVLAKGDEFTDKETVIISALPTFQGLAGGASGSTTRRSGGTGTGTPGRPGDYASVGGTTPGGAVAGGAADDGKGNKGVRDHGRGEGRDGAGQGKGKGKKK